MTFPIGVETPAEHDAPLPEAVDCAVIGGGIVGVTAALCLRRAGLRVALLEKGRIAAEQSSRNWGWIRVQGRDPAEVRIMLEARDLWRALDAECGGRTGLATCGVTYLARSARDMEKYAAWLKDVREFGLDCALLTSKMLRKVMPDPARGGWAGALHTPSDMRAEAWVAVPEIARLAAAEGVTVIEGCAVRGLDLEAGRVAGLVTENGRLRCASAVLAGGAWSALFLRRHGVALPQLSVRASVMATGPLPDVHAGNVAEDELAWRRRADGGYNIAPAGYSELFVGPDAFRALPYYATLLRQQPLTYRLRPMAPKGFPDAWTTPRRWADDAPGPFEAMRVLNPAPNMGKLRKAAARFTEIFPETERLQAKTHWAGMIDVLPDVVPAVDRVDTIPGLTLATGMCGHGFGIGPAFGRIAASLVRGDDPGHDLARFRLSRFRDGAPMVPGPSI